MARVLPGAAFARAPLALHTVPLRARFGRIYFDRYPDPLGYGKAPSRFSDPRRRVPGNRFGVLYLGETLKVCFLEAVLRDRRDGAVSDLPIDEDELRSRRYAEVETAQPLRLVDLRGDHAVVMGVPTDVAKASHHTLGRLWSVAFYEHSEQPDGVVYASRLNGHTNVAVYDRAVPRLKPARVTRLLAAAGIADVLTQLQVALVASNAPE